jgi:hypothetical protein
VPGAPDPRYLLARRILLDALVAIGEQRSAVVLVGAHAIYLHVGEEADLAVAPFTMDGDLAVVPTKLAPAPKLGEALKKAGFQQTAEVGIWKKDAVIGDEPSAPVTIDLLVPELLAGPGRREAKLGGHGDRVARKVRGLEAAVVNCSLMWVDSLETEDPRRLEVSVAGPAALLVAKLHKLADRQQTRRANDKDALDVLRLLRAVPTEKLANTLRVLREDVTAGDVTRAAQQYLRELFANRRGHGAQMAASAVQLLEDPDTIIESCVSLATDLLTALE